MSVNSSAVALRDDEFAECSVQSRTKKGFEHLQRIRHLQLTNFRSYAATSIAFDGRPVTFSGQNGAGKTNILEALSLIGPGRGLRSAKLSELWRLDGDGSWAVSARLGCHDQEMCSLGVGVLADAPDRRLTRIDGQNVSGPSAFSRYIRYVWLTPAQDRLFVEGASDRRRFFDRMVASHEAGFTRIISAYEHTMRQRQKLLEQGKNDDEWLSALEQQMSEHGVAIADARRRMAMTLAAQDIVGEGAAFPAADIALEGYVEAALDHNVAADVEDEFAERLKYQRRIDREAGRALYGPHRSDLIVGHRAKQCPARLCSTGEQKGLLIGLVLANAQSLSLQAASETPMVLLLDEIAAHLDEERRASLFDIIDVLGFQVFMTGTDRSLFQSWKTRAQHFKVSSQNDSPTVTEFDIS